MRSIIALRDELVASAAVVAIVVIALGLMIRVIDPSIALRRIGAALGYVIILIMVPPIIVHLWGALTLWQQLGVIAALGVTVTIVLHGRGSSSNRTNRQR